MSIPSPHCRVQGSGDVIPRANGRSEFSQTAVAVHSSPRPRSRRRLLRKNLRASVGDAAAFSVMVGIGETYFPAFVLALGLGEIASGLVVSLPVVIGAFLQMVTPHGVNRLRSNRRWVVTCVVVQALSFVPLVAAAVAGRIPAIGLFAAVSMYWAGGLGAGPAWNTWMETVVPFRVRAPFFAMRTRAGQACVLLGFVAGGTALQYGKHNNVLLWAFAIIFSIAGFCRLLSARYLIRQTEPGSIHGRERRVSVGELLGRIRDGKSERVLVYFLAVQVAVQISGPYFTPFMLKQLQISYLAFVGLIATSFVAKVIALPAFGRVAARFGARKLLWMGGIGIIPVSGLWLYAETYAELVALQFVAGTVWAAYELAMFLLFYETVRREERTSIMTVFNVANSIALAIGAIGGGLLLKSLDASYPAYLVLFALSSFARAASLVCLRFTPEHSELELEPDEPALQPAGLPQAATAVVSAPSK